MTKIMQGPFLWEYLNETPYTIRHTMAEYFLANEPLVVDVGTYKIPLKVNGELISIDPLNTFPGGYNKDVKIFLEEVNPINFSSLFHSFPVIMKESTFRLVALELELQKIIVVILNVSFLVFC